LADRDAPASATDRARSAFPDVEPAALAADKIHRFILGVDQRPRVMIDDEVARELNDPFARLLLRQGTFPTTLTEVLDGIDAATQDGDDLRRQMSFLVGEGSQIPWSAATDALPRGLRLAVTRGRDSFIDVLVSTAPSHDPGVFLQVMGWDEQNGVFHFYERKHGQWIWAGNSTHALDPAPRGQGPFDSHVNGSMVMKELKPPWNHWNSVDATIPPEVFAPDDPFRDDPLFTGKSGGEVFEPRVVRPGIQRWTHSRFAKTVSDQKVLQLRTLLEQLLVTTTVNLVSTGRESSVVQPGEQLALPATFFADTDTLTESLKLPAPPSLAVSGELYLDALASFEVALVAPGFRQPGDTHFAFLVPERAFEDIDVVNKCLETGVLSERFVGCALMVDFPNPIFSARRAQLLAHVPEQGDAPAAVSQTIADAIRQAADGSPQDSAEREFIGWWDLGDDWRQRATEQLATYYAAVAAGLGTAEGFNDCFRLAEARRRRVLGLDLSEARALLFAHSNVPANAAPLRMMPDGTVAPEA
jgi:hypothetical protein